MRSAIRKTPRMEVLEVKHTLAGAVQSFSCEAAMMNAPRAAVLLYTISALRRVAGLDLPAGTVTVAYFWADRPYNVYHWVSPERETIAWYFNLSGPASIAAGRVEWQDLEVDVLVTPDLRARVLDEDRLPADLPAERRGEIAAAADRVMREYAEVVMVTEAASRVAMERRPERR